MRDFRLDPENPPFVQLWATLPLRVLPHAPIPTEIAAWRTADQWDLSREWFNHRVDGERLLVYGRAMMGLLLAALGLAIYGVTRRLMGDGPALLALATATLWPTLTAHGWLVTSDVPMALLSLLALWSSAEMLLRPNLWRWLAAAGACSLLFLTKFSSVLVLPALVTMAVLAAVRRRDCGAAPRLRAALLGVSVALAVWVSIWGAYGFRFTMFCDDVPDPEQIADLSDARRYLRGYWWTMLQYTTEQRGRVAIPFAVERLERWQALPEAYLYGFTYMYHAAQGRMAYLMGQYSNTGWWYYFPVAFSIKTPIPILLLVAAGAALLLRRTRAKPACVLSTGLLVFGLTYALTSLTSRLNIGERHLLPLYPLLCMIAGAAAPLLRHRTGRIAGCAAGLWLVGSLAWNHPFSLAYFNELAGGPRRADRWLADSNLDWGQDLKRLAAWSRAHPHESIKLAYFGSADPTAYLTCTALPSYMSFEPPAQLAGGTYVISSTILSGTYDELLRPEYWLRADARRALRELATIAHGALRADAPDTARAEFELAKQEYPQTLAKVLISRLRGRPPDELIGRTLKVYRLSEDEVQALVRLQEGGPG